MNTIRGSDGLDYENLTERLLGKPAKTVRNARIATLRAQSRSKAYIRAWLKVWDEGQAAQEARVFRFDDHIRADAHVAGLAADGFYDVGAAVFTPATPTRSPG